jgi:hypothetical protein
MSKKIFSAQDWENVPSEIQQIHTPSIAPIYNKVEEDVESVVREIERRAIDIAPNYKDWVELGFACGWIRRERTGVLSPHQQVLPYLSKGRNG